MGAVKGKSVWWNNLSRLLNTHPLKAFIMKSIPSFIIYISATMCGGAVSVTDGQLVSCRSSLLEVLLPSGPSWSFLLTLVPSGSSLWLLGPASLWRSCSSKLWFYLVRHSTAATRVCTCRSRAIVRGSSSVWLLVAIEWVSTIQLFVWEVVIWLLLFSYFPIDGANWWCQKSLVSHTIFTCSKWNLRNRNKEDLAESTSLVSAKYPPKVKLENFHNSRMPELG